MVRTSAYSRSFTGSRPRPRTPAKTWLGVPPGCSVETRTGSIEALAAFRAGPDRFDLVVTDLTMPNMTGIVREVLDTRKNA